MDVVDENDYVDSYVDFFDADNDEPTDSQYAAWPQDDDGYQNQSLNSTFMNYSLERRFETRQQANEYLDMVYNGLWKFERTRPTKTGSKCFYRCKVLKECKSKCYILSTPHSDKVVLYKNNIEHDHSPRKTAENVATTAHDEVKLIVFSLHSTKSDHDLAQNLLVLS